MDTDTDNAPAVAPPTLTPAERKALKAQAHHLHPVVMIGEAGLSPAVFGEIERALGAHALIKIRVLGDDRAARAAMMAEVCARAGCAPVQMIGKMLVVYRPRPQGADAPAAAKRRKPSEPHLPKKSAGAATERGVAPPAAPRARKGRVKPSGGLGAAAARPGRKAAITGGPKPGGKVWAKVGAAAASGRAPRSGGAKVTANPGGSRARPAGGARGSGGGGRGSGGGGRGPARGGGRRGGRG